MTYLACDRRNYSFYKLFTLHKVYSIIPLAYVKCVKKLIAMQKVLAVVDKCMYNEEKLNISE